MSHLPPHPSTLNHNNDNDDDDDGGGDNKHDSDNSSSSNNNEEEGNNEILTDDFAVHKKWKGEGNELPSSLPLPPPNNSMKTRRKRRRKKAASSHPIYSQFEVTYDLLFTPPYYRCSPVRCLFHSSTHCPCHLPTIPSSTSALLPLPTLPEGGQQLQQQHKQQQKQQHCARKHFKIRFGDKGIDFAYLAARHPSFRLKFVFYFSPFYHVVNNNNDDDDYEDDGEDERGMRYINKCKVSVNTIFINV